MSAKPNLTKRQKEIGRRLQRQGHTFQWGRGGRHALLFVAGAKIPVSLSQSDEEACINQTVQRVRKALRAPGRLPEGAV